MMVDFLLVAGNDWFFVPIEFEVGRLIEIQSISMTDVFGNEFALNTTEVPSHLFTHARDGGQDPFPWLFVPPQGGQLGRVIQETVALRRDEMANIAWAIELARADELGRARDVEPVPRAPARSSGRDWVYELLSDVQPNWFPVFPRAQPAGPAAGTNMPVELVVGWRADDEVPRGRLLGSNASGNYVLDEASVSRIGVLVRSGVLRCRDVSGGTRRWMMRWAEKAGGEAASGLVADSLSRPTKS